MRVRSATADDTEACVDVLASLPDYFTASTHDEIRGGVGHQPGVVAEDGSEVVGFMLADQRYTASAEITYAAVRPGSANRGIGTALLDRMTELLADSGVVLVEVKTLDASAGYEPYVATRAFWERRGFIQVDCIDPLPGWEPGHPSAIYVRALRPT